MERCGPRCCCGFPKTRAATGKEEKKTGAGLALLLQNNPLWGNLLINSRGGGEGSPALAVAVAEVQPTNCPFAAGRLGLDGRVKRDAAVAM